MRERSDGEIAKLARVSSVISSSLDIETVLETSMRVVEELVDAEVSSIFETDDEGDELFFRVAKRMPEGYRRAVRLKIGEGVAGYVAATNRPLIVKDASRDHRFSSKVDDASGFHTRSIIALPIKNKGRTVGVLEVLNKRGKNRFDQDDLETLTIVASQIGTAIENAKLYARLKQKFALSEAELKRVQRKLLRAERLAALGQFAQGVAHELRNPIMTIAGFARRLGKMFPESNPAGRCVNIILEQAARVEAMIDSVERYTALPDPQGKPVRFSVFLRETLSRWRHEPNSGDVRTRVDRLSRDLTLQLDEALMAEALIHVLRNAREAMGSRGSILISAFCKGGSLVISVKDEGPGIPLEDLPSVFDPFFTSKTQGSGLGLAIVNRIVTGHGGDVEITSKPGSETDVKLRIPLFAGHASEK